MTTKANFGSHQNPLGEISQLQVSQFNSLEAKPSFPELSLHASAFAAQLPSRFPSHQHLCLEPGLEMVEFSSWGSPPGAPPALSPHLPTAGTGPGPAQSGCLWPRLSPMAQAVPCGLGCHLWPGLALLPTQTVSSAPKIKQPETKLLWPGTERRQQTRPTLGGGWPALTSRGTGRPGPRSSNHCCSAEVQAHLGAPSFIFCEGRSSFTIGF